MKIIEYKSLFNTIGRLTGMMKQKQVYNNNMIITYDCRTGKFTYPAVLREKYSEVFGDKPFWDIMKEMGFTNDENADRMKEKILELAECKEPQAYFEEIIIGDEKNANNWYRIGYVCAVPGEVISLTFTNVNKEMAENRHLTDKSEYDGLTGLLKYGAFCKNVELTMAEDAEGVKAGEYAMVYFDVLRFKAVNDMYGMAKGDRLLRHIADTIAKIVGNEDIIGRYGADRFVIFTHTTGEDLKTCVEEMCDKVTDFDKTINVTCNVGIFVPGEEELTVDQMIDRAVLAQSVIKGSYTEKYNFYTEQLREKMLGEQEIVGMMNTALEEKQFLTYFQPQYNHSTGTLVGAEALVRWKHPDRGLISPGVFIPIFEKNGFITRLDLYVFEEVCIFIRKCIDENIPIVPISVNFSKYDIFVGDLVKKLEEIRLKYDIPTKFLRAEITESAAVGGSKHVNNVVEEFHKYGYIVEMDDFGTGYSSLNILKDIDLDILKLDMLFLEENSDNNRGGTIVSSVVRMAKWLNMPVIAEGVETVEQADFLRSIGCDYIQGYLYSRPLEERAYRELVLKSVKGETKPQMKLLENIDNCNFWDPKSMETLIFSNYVGGAAIFELTNDNVEMLRVNKKYLDEVQLNISEKELINYDVMASFDDKNRKIFVDTLKKAAETGEEQECETWRNFNTSCCGDNEQCIRTTVRMIGKSKDTYLFYAMIRNITTEKLYYDEILNSEKRFKMASEQANIYYWEYTVETKEMRPCFRCMRDLGFPPVLTNYPESAIENGTFPPEVADMYRDWHVQIANGVKSLEAVIPLTADRIPFNVRYTTEFDEKGRPIKAYGSATLVVD